MAKVYRVDFDCGHAQCFTDTEVKVSSDRMMSRRVLWGAIFQAGKWRTLHGCAVCRQTVDIYRERSLKFRESAYQPRQDMKMKRVL